MIRYTVVTIYLSAGARGGGDDDDLQSAIELVIIGVADPCHIVSFDPDPAFSSVEISG